MTAPDSPSAPAARAVGSSLAGCTIEAVLHAGPVCTVYRVRDAAGPPGAGRFALKEYGPQALCERDAAGTPQLRASADAAARAAFEAGRTAFLEELRMLSRLHLPGLVPVLQIREEQGVPCALMPLLPGEPLQRRPIPQKDDALHAQLLALLEPLAQLHAVGVVHGALHGRQLLWAPGHVPVLLGFSLAARALGRPREGASPPEAGPQGAHLPQGPWSDLYALAAMVLGQLSGQAWSGPPTAAGVGAVLEQALGPTPETAKRHLLVKAFLSCLQPSPSERPPHAGALRELLGGGPARAPQAAQPHAQPQQPSQQQLHPHARPPAAAAHPAAPHAHAHAQQPLHQQPHPQPPGGHAPEGAAGPGQASPGAAAQGGAPARTPGPDRHVPAAVRSAGFVMPALPPRRPDNQRRVVLVSLLLAVGCGVMGWWVRDLWQQEQERHRVDRLLVTATTQAPPQPGWAAAAALPAVDDAVAARVAAADAAATAALQATAARVQPVAAELPAQAAEPVPALAEVPARPAPATLPVTPPAAPSVAAPVDGPAAAPVHTAAAFPSMAPAAPKVAVTPSPPAATPPGVPAPTGPVQQAPQKLAAQGAAAPKPPAPAAVPSPATAGKEAVPALPDRPPVKVAAAPAQPAPGQAAANQGVVLKAPDKPVAKVDAAALQPTPDQAAGQGAARQGQDQAVKTAAATPPAVPAAAVRPEAKAARPSAAPAPRVAAKPAATPVRSARASGPAPAPARSGPPRNACASLSKYALLQCMQRQCSQAASRRHPQCQRLLNDNVLSS